MVSPVGVLMLRSRSWWRWSAAVVAMTIAARRIPIQIPRKVMGRGRIREGQKTFIPIRLITAGVMPIIFAQTIIIVPGTLASFTKNPVHAGRGRLLHPGRRCRTTSSSRCMILLFSYFYTSIIFNSVDLAENLKKQGGFIPGVKPGASTADYIDAVLARITLPGGALPGPGGAGPDPGLQASACSAIRRYLGADRGRRAARHASPRWSSTARSGSTTAS